MHLVILDRKFESQQDKTYALVRGFGGVSSERYFNVFFDSDRLSPSLITYVMSELLHAEFEYFLKQLTIG